MKFARHFLDRMSFLVEATHPQCFDEGCPDGPGRASHKEGESWGMIAKLSLGSIPRSCAMRLRLRKQAGTGRCAISAKWTRARRRHASWWRGCRRGIAG